MNEEEYEIVYTIKHRVKIKCKPSDLDSERELTGMTLVSNGTENYTNHAPKEVMHSSLSFTQEVSGDINL